MTPTSHSRAGLQVARYYTQKYNYTYIIYSYSIPFLLRTADLNKAYQIYSLQGSPIYE